MAENELHLRSDVPLALFPVRLETRFTADRMALRVRVYPDDVQLQTEPPPARARLLPDRWCVVAYHGGRRTEVFSRPIANEVVAGLDLNGPLTKVEGEPVSSSKSRWLFDYRAAVKMGMAVTLRFEDEPVDRVERLIVFGVHETLEPRAAARRLTKLFKSHGDSAGIAFVPQGTPTNNTDTRRTPWTERPGAGASGETPAATLPTRSNAETLARALGLDTEVFADLPHAADAEAEDARAMAMLLWEPSWGTFLQKLAKGYGRDAALTPGDVEAARSYFVAHVRARGPLPAIRVGNQPYGVLPAFSLDLWQDTGTGDPTRSWLPGFLKELREIWRASLPSVPRLVDAPPGKAFDDLLLDVLAMSPTCRDVRVRSVVTETFCRALPQFLQEEQVSCEAERRLNQYVLGLAGLANTKLAENGSVQKDARPLGLPFVIDDPKGEESPDRSYLRSLANGRAGQRPESLLSLLAKHALDLESKRRDLLRDHATGGLSQVPDPKVRVELGRHAQTPLAAGSLASISSRLTELRSANPVRGDDPVAAILGRSTTELETAALTVDSAALAVVDGWVTAESHLAELNQAFEHLASLPAERLQLLLAEGLDLASHRLDAWLTALATRRLLELRAVEGGEEGISLGAFGWVENLTAAEQVLVDPHDTTDHPLLRADTPGGYVHAPSIAQANTAAILRAGHLAHVALDPASTVVAIDLSSRRVRLATSLLEGIQQGQQLGALLGYRLERWLHEAAVPGVLELDRFVSPLRRLAPLVADKLQADLEDPGVTAESVAANNVVDGLRLLDSSDAEILDFLAAREAMTEADRRALGSILRQLRDLSDAVADLLLAEAVHQLASGNMDRAGAALDAAGAGESAPPEPEVVRTPPTGLAVTYRLLTLVDARAEDPQGYSDTRARALAEPRLEKWARRLLGPATRILIAEASPRDPVATAADVGLCALDFVYGGDNGLLRWLARQIGPDRALALARRAATPAGMVPLGDALELGSLLRELVAGGRSLGPDSRLAPGQTERAAPDFEELGARFESVRAVLEARSLEAASAADAGSPRARLVAALRDLNEIGVLGGESLDLDAASLRQETARAAVTARQRLERGKRLADEAAALSAEVLDTAEQALLRDWDVAARLCSALEALFGGALRALPLVRQPNPPSAAPNALPFSNAAGGAEGEAEAIRAWLEAMARLRSGVSRFNDVGLVRDALDVAAPEEDLSALQLPSAQAKPGTAPPRWVAPPFRDETLAASADAPSPRGPITVLIQHTPGEISSNAEVAGLIVDEWVEVLPRRVERTIRDDAAPEDARTTSVEVPVTTALAVNANAPNARAPQAVLLAVSPNGRPWTKAALEATLLETLELAKLRAVTLESVIWVGRLLPALYFSDYAVQGEVVAPFLEFAAKASARELDFVKG
jgi:hypothetical protein